MTIAEARAEYTEWGAFVDYHLRICPNSYGCWTIHAASRHIDAASIALDMLNAERLVGRNPRIASKGIPLS